MAPSTQEDVAKRARRGPKAPTPSWALGTEQPGERRVGETRVGGQEPGCQDASEWPGAREEGKRVPCSWEAAE